MTSHSPDTSQDLTVGPSRVVEFKSPSYGDSPTLFWLLGERALKSEEK